MVTVPLWLNGQEVSPSKMFDTVSPRTRQVIHQAAAASLQDAEAALASSNQAFQTWSLTRHSERRDIFLRAADIFLARKEECWNAVHDETGCDRAYFEFTFDLTIQACKDVAGLVQAIAGTLPQLADANRTGVVLREPYGVVLSIAPWNAPYVLGARAVLQPLACGNTVILKGSELSPKSFWILASVFHEAGLPAGCLNTIYHAAGQDAVEITKYLIASPVIKKINFTGSDRVGSIIASLAGERLKPVVVELGGKASAIVCDDADIEKAALQAALGAFMYGGQICMSTERIIVHKEVMTRFTAALDRVIDDIFGRQAENQHLISNTLLAKNALLMNDAISKGAKILKGDLQMFDSGSVRPLVLADVHPAMDVYYAESFGPSVSLFAAESDEEAIRIANDTEYGLTAAVFTENLQRGLRIARRLESGAVHINNMTVFEDGALPAGGVKQSGFGRFNTSIGLEEWVRTKTLTWAN